jgi:hypothetical protein
VVAFLRRPPCVYPDLSILQMMAKRQIWGCASTPGFVKGLRIHRPAETPSRPWNDGAFLIPMDVASCAFAFRTRILGLARVVSDAAASSRGPTDRVSTDVEVSIVRLVEHPNLNPKETALVVLSWTPSLSVAGGKFHRVLLPPEPFAALLP